MLAGRKLLLADDSITIQKVVDLTFADEGVSVVCVSNGREAIERLAEFSPDIVLADAFMPEMSGYEVCEYIKQNEKLKKIPVMLLVGSFEPFDEAEARRVGADDTLTKPFQSIRRLIDKVGLLVGSRQSEEQIPTAELPKPEGAEEEPEQLSEKEIEVTTADTQPLPPEMGLPTETSAAARAGTPQSSLASKMDGPGMGEKVSTPQGRTAEKYEGAGEVLLDLGDYVAGSTSAEDFVLDIDLDDIHDAAPAASAFPMHAFVGRNKYQPRDTESAIAARTFSSMDNVVAEMPVTNDQLAETQEFPSSVASAPAERSSEPVFVEPEAAANPMGSISPEQLSPEMIDAIAKRAVEHLSEKVIQEIAWEVVPPLAELLIKRQLEEKST